MAHRFLALFAISATVAPLLTANAQQRLSANTIHSLLPQMDYAETRSRLSRCLSNFFLDQISPTLTSDGWIERTLDLIISHHTMQVAVICTTHSLALQAHLAVVTSQDSISLAQEIREKAVDLTLSPLPSSIYFSMKDLKFGAPILYGPEDLGGFLTSIIVFFSEDDDISPVSDSFSARALPHSAGSFPGASPAGNLTVQASLSACGTQGFSIFRMNSNTRYQCFMIAGVEFGAECFCGNELASTSHPIINCSLIPVPNFSGEASGGALMPCTGDAETTSVEDLTSFPYSRTGLVPIIPFNESLDNYCDSNCIGHT
ncbi:LOW QUALITY PROTEIN: hypothetical protein CVT26_013285 [Gymnopilus dilepis]|uniref:WSC domain-containing protein n=1 Tax=Gymnopilus dilepis TaxID=231916 RepID=A0A409VUS3_9AGAR|nr:LOW QUALITY PROTEIN: hypothetical protein CVT26_013285 [Gymnopilus dilepis]